MKTLEDYRAWAKSDFIPVIGPPLYKNLLEHTQAFYETVALGSLETAFTLYGTVATFCVIIAFRIIKIKDESSSQWDDIGAAVSSTLTSYLSDKFCEEFKDSDWVRMRTSWINGMRAAETAWCNSTPIDRESKVALAILRSSYLPVSNDVVEKLARGIEPLTVWIFRVFEEAQKLHKDKRSAG